MFFFGWREVSPRIHTNTIQYFSFIYLFLYCQMNKCQKKYPKNNKKDTFRQAL